MAQPNYKFKPYAPTKLKKKKTAGTDDIDKTIKSLQKQRENLDARLRAEGIDPETLGGEFDNRNLLEKALNLNADQGLLMDFFEIIDRPVQGVKNALIAGKRGDNFFQGLAEGLAGTKEVTGAEFIKELTGFEAQNSIVNFATNVGADIVFDPLTYLPPGIIAKGLSKLGKIGSRTITEVGEEIISESAERAAKIIADANSADAAISASAKAKIKTIEQMDDLRKSTDDLLKQSGQDLPKGTQTEIDSIKNYRSKMDDYLREQGLSDIKDDYVIISEGTTRKGRRVNKDISVYMKVKGSDGVEQFVKINTIEVKDLTGKGFGITGALDVDEFARTGAIAGDANAGTKFIRKLKETNPKLAEALETALRNKDTGAVNKIFRGKNKQAIRDTITSVFYDDLVADGVSHLSLRLKNGKIISMSVDNAKKYLKIVSGQVMENTGKTISKFVTDNLKQVFKKAFNVADDSLFGQTAKAIKGKAIKVDKNTLIVPKGIKEKSLLDKVGQVITDAAGNKTKITAVGKLDDGTYVLRTSNVGKNARPRLSSSLQLEGVDEAGKKLTEEFFETLDETGDVVANTLKPGQGAQTVTRTLTLAGRARAGEFGETIQRVAKAYKSFEIKFKLTFNLTAGFDAKTKALLMKAQGVDMFDLERRSGVLASIKEELIKVDPDAGVLLGEIIEADAKLVNGVITKLKRQMGTSDFFDYMYNAIVRGDGDKIVIPEFANADAQREFLNQLHKIYKKATGSTDIVFTIPAKGAKGGTVLKFAGDASEMKDLIKYIADPANIRNLDTHLKFGEKALSKKAKAFLRNNSEKIQKYKNLSDELLDDLVNVAGFKNMPVDLQKQIGYMRHTMTKEAMEGLRKQMPGVLSIYTAPGGRTLGKRNLMGSVQEINAALSDFYGMTEDFFDPNAFNAMEDLIKQVSRRMDERKILDIILTNKGVDGSDLFKVVDNTQAVKAQMSPYDVMIKDFREDFKTLYENLSPEAREVFDAFLVKNGYDASKAIQMNKSAFNVLKGVEKAYFDVPALAKIYDKFLTAWKGLTLITPGFHMRNLFGNMFNSYAVGMDVVAQGKYLGVAMQELDTFQKIGKKLAQGLDITASERKIYDTVKGYFEQGVSQTHRGIRDLETVMEASAKGTSKSGTLKNTYNNVIRFNFNVAEKMDDVQRYALYRWSLDKTGDGVKAANTVAEALFDYSHLTPFEKSYMKRLFPFYTFMKNNFVFQMKNIFKNPAQYAKLGRAYKYASEDLAGYSLDDLPDYATENMWIPLPWTVDKNDKDAIVFLKATLPASDFTELVENPFKKGVTSITAPLKLLIEFGAGKDLFTGQPLEAFPGQTSAMPEGTGVLSGLRDRRGNLTISQSPIFIKIMNDLGLRAPINIASAGLDIVDTLAGYQGGVENVGDFLQRAGIAGVSEMDRLKLSKLYQDLEKLRELKKFYEQETGNQLPVLPRG